MRTQTWPTIFLYVGGRQTSCGGKLVTRKLALRRDVSASRSSSAEGEQLVCRGRACYDVEDPSTAEPSCRRRGGPQGRPVRASRTLSRRGDVRTARSDEGPITMTGSGPSSSSSAQLTQTISVRRMQLRRTQTLINSTPVTLTAVHRPTGTYSRLQFSRCVI